MKSPAKCAEMDERKEEKRQNVDFRIILDQSESQREIYPLLLVSHSPLNPPICLCHHKITDGTEKNTALYMGKNGWVRERR